MSAKEALLTEDAHSNQQSPVQNKKTSIYMLGGILVVILIVTLVLLFGVYDIADNNDESSTSSVCPGLFDGTPPSQSAAIPSLSEYNAALSELDIESVVRDISVLMASSGDCWPADSFNDVASYGPFFIRLAWHCSGTYRNTDGAGGCGGGRQRFPPEASWEDNTNLDKARALLRPIKDKYGVALSWGDLFVFAGSTAILNMSGPVHSLCAGRIDSEDGTDSLVLGSDPSNSVPPCEVQGDCKAPLGSSTIGLIYVNPEGFMADPDPLRSAEQIRNVFARMGMNDKETVALIGGGHAFGKCHGACPEGAGASPSEDPSNPWPGQCGSGKGRDTFTSGLEGAWTSSPLRWDNEYFQMLIDDEYELIKGAGDKNQWRNVNSSLLMLTTDLALVYDANYSVIVREFAENITALNVAFSGAWSKLTTSGGEWAEEEQCVNVSSAIFL